VGASESVESEIAREGPEKKQRGEDFYLVVPFVLRNITNKVDFCFAKHHD
jgi:hypothetical protein